MNTFKMDWPTKTTYSRIEFDLPADGAIVQFTVPATDPPRPGQIKFTPTMGVGGPPTNMTVMMSAEPNGAPLKGRYADQTSTAQRPTPTINFNVGRVDSSGWKPDIAPGQTTYTTVKPVGATGRIAVDLTANHPF